MNLYVSGYHNPVYNTVHTLKKPKTMYDSILQWEQAYYKVHRTKERCVPPLSSIEEQTLSRISSSSPTAEACCHHF